MSVITERAKQFLESFKPTDLPNDPLPIKVLRSSILKEEAVGQGTHWAFEYLYQRVCPHELLGFILHDVRKEIKNIVATQFVTETLDQDDTQSQSEDSEIKPLIYMQSIVKAVDDILLKIKEIENDEELKNKFPDYFKNNEDEIDNSVLTGIRIHNLSYYSMKNTRRSMEDKMVVFPCMHKVFDLEKRISCFALFDGHNGTEASAYGAAQLLEFLVESLKTSVDTKDAIKEAFRKTDEKFLEKCKTEKLRSGTTVVLAVIEDQKLYVSWVGDSQAVLCSKNGEAIQLVCSHKPEREDERIRIQNMGGEVMEICGTWRVNGTLAVSRSIGDTDFKEYVTSTPDIIEIDGKDLDGEYLILATDGLWDVMNTAEVKEKLEFLISQNKGLSAAQVLALRAKSKGSSDNTSIIIVYLKDLETLCSLMKDRIPPDYEFEAESQKTEIENFQLDSEGADQKQNIHMQEPSQTMSELINLDSNPEVIEDFKPTPPILDLGAEITMENLKLSSDVAEEKSLVEENLMGDFENNSKVGFTVEGDGIGEKSLVDFNLNSTNQEATEYLKSIQLDLGAEIVVQNLNLSSIVPQENIIMEDRDLMEDMNSKVEFNTKDEKLGGESVIADLNLNSNPEKVPAEEKIIVEESLMTDKVPGLVEGSLIGDFDPLVNVTLNAESETAREEKNLLPDLNMNSTPEVVAESIMVSSTSVPQGQSAAVEKSLIGDLKAEPAESKAQAEKTSSPTKPGTTQGKISSPTKKVTSQEKTSSQHIVKSKTTQKPQAPVKTTTVGKHPVPSVNSKVTTDAKNPAIKKPLVNGAKALPKTSSTTTGTTAKPTNTAPTVPTLNRPRLNNPVAGLKAKPLVSKDVKPIGATRPTGTNLPTGSKETTTRVTSAKEPRPIAAAKETTRPTAAKVTTRPTVAKDTRPIGAKETRPIGKVQPESSNNIRPPTTTATSKTRPNGTNMTRPAVGSARSVPGAPPTTKPITGSVGTKPATARPPGTRRAGTNALRPTASKEAAPRTTTGSSPIKKTGTNPTKKIESPKSPSKAVNGIAEKNGTPTPVKDKETASGVIVAETNGTDQVHHSEKTETANPVKMNGTEEITTTVQTVTNNVSEEQAGVLEEEVKVLEEVKETVANEVQAM